jgi:DNA-binding MarR family transcriptional regulator
VSAEPQLPGSLAAHALARRPAYVLIKLGEAVKAGAEETLGEVGLTGRQFDLMASIAADGSVSQRDLGRLLGLDPNVVGDIVDELEARGLLTRARSERDRRRHVLALTASGRRLLTKAEDAATAGERTLLADLTADEIDTLHRLTSRLLQSHWPPHPG